MKQGLRLSRFWVMLILAVSLCLFIVIGGIFIKKNALNSVRNAFTENNCSYSNIRLNLYNRSVTINDFIWHSPNSSNSNSIQLLRVQLKGINFYELLWNKIIYAKTFLLDSGSVNYTKPTVPDSSKLALNLPLINIEEVVIHKVAFEIKTNEIVTSQGVIDVSFGSVIYDQTKDLASMLQSGFNHFKGTISDCVFKNPTGLYTIQTDQISFNSNDQSMTLSALHLIPNYGKYEFAHVVNEQCSRIELNIPAIQMKGLNYKSLLDKRLLVQKITLTDVKLYSFRDKRLPLNRAKIAPMPMELLAQLPFAVEIDSIVIANAHLTIEDFAEKSVRPGYIVFNDLNGTFLGLSNQYYLNKPKFAQLDASSQIMDNGLITASFRFPLDGTPLYSAVGKISNLPLKVLNPMFENSALIKIESGHLNELYFNFNYTDFTSKGSIEINYEDLKVSSLNVEDDKKTVNLIKTTLIHIFTPKTKDDSMARRNRVGTIDVERDKNRMVFNLWWTSLQSGLKSCFLDKYQLKDKKK